MNDQQLMAHIAQGDKAAFTEFVSHYLNKMVDFACRYVSRRADAEDIVQEAFERVWRKASSWQDKDVPPRSWLYRIVYNLCMDELRKNRNTASIADDIEPGTTATPEEGLHQEVQQRKLQMALQSLPERQRTALVLCAYHGLSNREAAAILAVSVDALESLLARGRRTLRERLLEAEGKSL